MNANRHASAKLTLLTNVKDEVTSCLSQLLHDTAFISLDRQTQPTQTTHLGDIEIQIGTRHNQWLPPRTRILDVFDRSDVAGKLLILGEPGSGKTTTLLNLAQELLQRAETDATYPMPVLLNLSSWTDPPQRIASWLVEELKLKYGVHEDIGKQWLKERKLLPLLDGLDEVEPGLQAACVKELNDWFTSPTCPHYLAICSRQKTYEVGVSARSQQPIHPEIAESTTVKDSSAAAQLQLNRAIVLQPLNDDQIQTYLTRVNHPELWQSLRQNASLLELVRTPLWLNITVLSYSELSTGQWQQLTVEQRIEQLLDAYVQTMLHLELGNNTYGTRKPPSARQTRQWLTILAKHLEAESQSEFLIERIEPLSWLRSNSQQWMYKLLLNLSLGLLSGLFYGPFLALIYGLFVFPLVLGLIIGLILGLFLMLFPTTMTMSPVVAIQPSLLYQVQRKFLQRSPFYLGGGLTVGLTFGLIDGLPVGLASGLLFGLLLGWFLELGREVSWNRGANHDIEIPIRPNQGIWNSARNTALIVGSSLPIVLAAIFWLPGALNSFGSPLSKPLLASIVTTCVLSPIWMGSFQVGGFNCLQHFALRYALYRSGDAPWNYARFLDYCTERLLLQRIGGRYRFIHKALQDHFAKMRV